MSDNTTESERIFQESDNISIDIEDAITTLENKGEYGIDQAIDILRELNDHQYTKFKEIANDIGKGSASGVRVNARVSDNRRWKSVGEVLPEESGRYWCYVEEITDLGKSHYQWNCAYNTSEERFSSEFIHVKVTHWMPLPKPPE